MKVKLDELTRVIEGFTGKRDNKQQLRAIAHWLKKVKDSNNYASSEESEMPSLLRLGELKLIGMEGGDKTEKIGTVVAKLTASGEELYSEMFRAGYFLKA